MFPVFTRCKSDGVDFLYHYMSVLQVWTGTVTSIRSDTWHVISQLSFPAAFPGEKQDREGYCVCPRQKSERHNPWRQKARGLLCSATWQFSTETFSTEKPIGCSDFETGCSDSKYHLLPPRCDPFPSGYLISVRVLGGHCLIVQQRLLFCMLFCLDCKTWELYQLYSCCGWRQSAQCDIRLWWRLWCNLCKQGWPA